jgi:hypothetical protein
VEVGFHSLRHTFVSLCRESNAPLAVVESIVGHSNPAMTRHYTHVGELAAGRAVAALPSVIDQDDSQPASPTPESVLVKIHCLVSAMTRQNWRQKQGEVMALLLANAKAVPAEQSSLI